MKETWKMIRSTYHPALLAAGLLVMPIAHAADWTGKGELGALLARGNADATSADAKLDVAQVFGDWKDAAHLAFLYGKNASFTTAQRIEAGWQTNYNFSPRMFVFGAVAGEDDKFSGFVYQVTLSTGVGYKIIDSDSTKLTGTVGVGYRRLQSETLIKDPNGDGEVIGRIKGDTTGDAVATAGIDYVQQLTKTTKLTDKFLVTPGDTNTAAQNDFAVQVAMSDRLALSVGYGIRYNSNPPLGAKTTDQLTTINIVYDVKETTASTK
jgi:putative salt-induced outer membrane protein